ncbi:MAG TPA: hypothetical protein VME21_10565 [Steroidobacteraceae bacterium]|nr:hypothetical protein [Steroidobacteraceae bacterium]
MAAAPTLGDRVSAAPAPARSSCRAARGAACLLALAAALPVRADTYFLTVAGLGGEPDYEQRFRELAGELDRALAVAGGPSHRVTLAGAAATRAGIRHELETIAQTARPSDDLVVVLIGHGSFDGVQYKFNLPGPDLSAQELASLCNRVRSQRQLIVNTTSASGGSVSALARRGRAVIAATKSGTEKNATVFARYFIEALQDPTADVDKNETVSALEAFEYAVAKTTAFYESQQRLATEHAVFEDAGRGPPVRHAAQGQGRLLASLALVRFGGARAAAADPAKRALLVRKEQLEQRIDTLKLQRAALAPQAYRQQLTSALLELARVQQELDR